MDCSLILFSQRGYEAVGVQDVVDAAGVTKPTLYHYFGSKRGLLDTLLQREAIRLLLIIQRASNYQGDLVLTLEYITRAYFNFAKEYSVFYRMHLSMYFSAPESEANQAIRPYALEQMEILAGVFDQASENHGNLRGRQGRYAAGLLGTINAMIGLYLNDGLDLTDDLVYQMVHQFMHGIFS
jgi:TetR/AcrR family transcriptional regulator